MKNIVDYALSEQRPFTDKPFCTVDSLILSTASYFRFDGLVPGLETDESVALGRVLESNAERLLLNLRDAKVKQDLLEALLTNPRYRDLRLGGHVDQFDEAIQKQFSATTFFLPDGTAYVAFRGTDNSVVGWKEDFNMTYLCPIPAQTESVSYLNRMAERLPDAVRLGGHSKGGNLAVYASMECAEAYHAKISEIYSHDGPGFPETVIQSERYRAIQERIHLTVPQSSVIGMMLYHKGEYSVVESNKFWFFQHDPFSWEIDGDDFRYAQRLSNGATYLNAKLDRWIGAFTNEQRALFVDSIYQIVRATNANTLMDLTEDWFQKAVAVLNATKDIDPKTKRFLRQTIGALIFAKPKWLTSSIPSEHDNEGDVGNEDR